MTTSEWHVDEELWQAYAAGRLDDVTEASVDAHVTGCEVCRGTARSVAPPMEALWREISTDISRPALPWTLRWLRRLGVREDDLVILSASDGFMLPWAMALGGSLLCVAITAMSSEFRAGSTYLLLAPLVPVLAVLAAFDATDVLRRLVMGTAYSKLRLMLLRTTATLVFALPSAFAVGVLVPDLASLEFAGSLLPSLALTSAALMLLTWFRPWVSAGTVALGWAAVVLPSWRSGDVSHLTGLAAQLGFLGLTMLLVAALAARTSTYKLLGGEG